MEIAEHVSALEGAGGRLAAAATAAGPGARVPSCPEWAVRDLIHHTGGVHRWARSFVVEGGDRETTDEEDARHFQTVADDDLVAWFREGHASLVAALRAAPADLECWTFLPAPSPLAFWARRQAHETAIHGVDAELAAGSASPFPVAFAADGIDELLNGFLARRRGRLVADPAVVLSVETTDADAAWSIRIGPDSRQVTAGVTPGADCSIAGPASDLYLFLWNRAGPERLAIDGDRELLSSWTELAAIRWS